MSDANLQTEKIERYLLNKMSEEEKSSFQTELLLNARLRAEVKEFRTIQKVIYGNLGEQKKASKKSAPFNWKWLLLLLLPLIYFLLPFNNFLFAPEKKDLPTVVESQTETKEQHQPKEPKLPEEKAVNPVEKSKPKVVKPVPAKPKVKKKEVRPIAKTNPADFLPNAYLEEFVEGVRNDEVVIEMTIPQNNTVFKLVNGFVKIGIQGRLVSGDMTQVKLTVFDNQPNSYVDYKPLINKDLKIENQVFSFSEAKEMNPGLYYFILETEEEEQLLVGKFFVRP